MNEGDMMREYWDNHADEHRRGINDMEWAAMQEKGPALYSHGDIVEFKVGGFGRIGEVSEANGGWPVSYSVMSVPGKPFHARNISAWHYEGDIKGLFKEASKEISEIIRQLNDDKHRSLVAHVERASS